MQKPVLIVIDMLNDFLEKWDRSDRDRLIDAINHLVRIMSMSLMYVRAMTRTNAFPRSPSTAFSPSAY